MVSTEEGAHHPPVPDETLQNASAPPAEEPTAEASKKTPLTEAEGKAPGGGFSGGGGEEGETEKALALADELFEKGSKAIEADQLVEAADCLSRALEIRVAHYGELAFECATLYYKYGCALLYKAQEEADPLGNVPKGSSKSSTADTTVKNVEENASSKASVNSEREEGQSEKDQEEDDGESEGDDEDLADEDDSDLDLAWKMLDVARAIVEKRGEDTLERVKILSALGEASLEREDFETSLSDYHQALSILGRLVEPDHRRMLELNFRICLVLEVASKTEEAVPYCEKSIALCMSRLQRLREEVAKIKGSASVADLGSSSLNERVNESLGVPLSEKEEEIELISGFQGELEMKLQDLQHAISNPKSVLSEVLKMAAANLPHGDKNMTKMEARSISSSSTQSGEVCGGFDTPAVSIASANGNVTGNVTHLGVVGRGVKRASAVQITEEPTPKRSSLDSSAFEILDSTCKDSETPN